MGEGVMALLVILLGQEIQGQASQPGDFCSAKPHNLIATAVESMSFT